MSDLAHHVHFNHRSIVECPQCDKTFRFRTGMRMHKRQVHNKVTHTCCICSGKFKSFQDLKNHLQQKCKTKISKKKTEKSKTGLNCYFCTDIFSKGNNFISHIAEVHKDKEQSVHKCEQCKNEFNSNHESQEHTKIHHIAKKISTLLRLNFKCYLCKPIFDR